MSGGRGGGAPGPGTAPMDWAAVPARIRRQGLRWTPQRQTVLDVLARSDGHVTGSTLVAACRDVDPSTTPSTVYRTLDVLESLGVLAHSHGLDGREEFHVGPAEAHGHLICTVCGEEREVPAGETAAFVETLRRDHGFTASIDHLSIAGRCAGCSLRP
ncbi:MAG: Fur family transcriptional regulator [Candidatus Limnocylindrales bacterium]